MMSASAAAGGEEGVVRNNNNNNNGGRFPFTASQWEELEHQALVYKYIISGIPIPPHLLFTIKTTTSSSIPPIGWNWGFGRKIDPEPGRCRRTDGKKWRCSKEAYPDSKYCERHMHRGRNRSRKPVELSPNYPSQYPLSVSSSSSDFFYNNNNNNPTHLISSSSSSSNNNRPPAVLSSRDSNPSSYRKSYGVKEEHLFFSESSGSTIKAGDSWQLSMNNNSYAPAYQQQQDGYYNDHQLQLRLRKEDDEPQKVKVMHHFFDERPDSSTTQLSISIPTTSAPRDFFLSGT